MVRNVSHVMSQRGGLARTAAKVRVAAAASRQAAVSLAAVRGRMRKYRNANPTNPPAIDPLRRDLAPHLRNHGWSAKHVNDKNYLASLSAGGITIPQCSIHTSCINNSNQIGTQFPHLHTSTSGLLHTSLLFQNRSSLLFQHGPCQQRSLHTSRPILAPPLFALMAKLIGPLVIKLPGFKILAAKLIGKGAMATRGGMTFLKLLKLTSKILPWVGRWAALKEHKLQQKAKELGAAKKPTSLDDFEKVTKTVAKRNGTEVEVQHREKLSAEEIIEKRKGTNEVQAEIEKYRSDASGLRHRFMLFGGAVAGLTGVVWAASLEEQDEHFQDGKDFLSPVLDLNYMSNQLERVGVHGQNDNPINTDIPLNKTGKTVLVQREGHPVLRRMRSFVGGKGFSDPSGRCSCLRLFCPNPSHRPSHSPQWPTRRRK